MKHSELLYIHVGIKATFQSTLAVAMPEAELRLLAIVLLYKRS